MGNSAHKFCCVLPLCGSMLKLDCSAGKATWLEVAVLLLIPIIFYMLGFNTNFIKLLLLILISYSSLVILRSIRCKKSDLTFKLKHSIISVLPLLIVSIFIFIMSIIPTQILVDMGPVGGVLTLASGILNTVIGGLLVGLITLFMYTADLQITTC